VVQRPFPALFVADAPGLDFLNSIASPVGEVLDWIDDGDGLLDWLEQARLVPLTTLDALRKQSLADELDKVAAQARGLREWFRSLVRDRMGRALEPDGLRELAPLNSLLKRDDAFSQIVGGIDGRLELRPMRRWRSAEDLLLPIGETLAKLVCEEDFSHVKACEGHNCTLLFVDHTRRRTRRWCSMAVCGNRAKQAAHRNRIRNQGL
jgi:predicted RNA-binding Zn ribbon-like protein